MADYNQVKNGAKQEAAKVAVVAVSFPAHSHLNSLLHLCRRISAYNVPVHYVGAAAHLHQATARIHGCDPSAITNLHLHHFPSPPFPTLPSPSTNSSTRFPSHLLPMFTATLPQYHAPLHALVSKLISESNKKVVIIFDELMASVVRVIHRSFPNLECYSFQSIPAFFAYSFLWEATGKMEVLPSHVDVIMQELPSMEGCFSSEFQEFMASNREGGSFNSGTIYNTSKAIDGFYLDLIEKSKIFMFGRSWALGPLIALCEQKIDSSKNRSKCLDWLDKQPRNSVIFVSFGTTCSFSCEEIEELGLGLERSGQRFLWVLREADKGVDPIGDEEVGEFKMQLGFDFEERVKRRGIVVREWAPQLEILQHSATGGFVSHCGWNSCLESLSTGVPILAWPMHSDQPRNAFFVTKVLNMGVEVRDWGRRDEVVGAAAVEEGVRRLMETAEGDEMRRRAEELAVSLKESMAEGGSGRREMDSFVDHIACIGNEQSSLMDSKSK